MVIYNYVERSGEFSLPSIFSYNIYNHQKYYPGETININVQSLIIISRIKIRSLPPKRVRGELPLFSGNVERVIPFYGEKGLYHQYTFWLN